jgi:hypothetical protein
MQISVGEFGKTADGRQVQAWRLEGDGGAYVHCLITRNGTATADSGRCGTRWLM